MTFLLTVGCGGDEGGSATGAADAGYCASASLTCPTRAPSYEADVAPIVGNVCASCHSTFTSYATVYASRGAILDQVYACRMPPSDGPALSQPDRQTLLGWLSCGAPQN